jgi:uncharacterized protein (TIGR03066 family)
MRCLRLTSVAGLAIGLLVCAGASLQADDKTGDKKSNAEKIVGTWQLTKSPQGPLPPGTSLIATFDKDSKVSFKTTAMGQSRSASGTYKVDGKKLTITAEGGKKDATTIKTLDDKKLVLVNAQGMASEFKKAEK